MQTCGIDPRYRLIAARAANIAAIDGPFAAFKDVDGLNRDCRVARLMGMNGKWAVHPGQAETIAAQFTPSQSQVDQARKQKTAFEEALKQGQGAVAVDGAMVDQASINLLEPLLADAELSWYVSKNHVTKARPLANQAPFCVSISIQVSGHRCARGTRNSPGCRRLSEALSGRTPDSIQFHYPSIARKTRRVRGKSISRVRAHGKALLIDFSNGLTLYSHNQLYGLWYIGQPESDPFTHRQLRVEIRSLGVTARLYSASSIELWKTDRLHQHPFYPN